jgi:PAS domain S-box-containing protein
MPTTQRRQPLSFHLVIALLIVVVGAMTSVLAYRAGRTTERERAEAEFARRVTLRHAFTREILGRYEDSLFGLAALFMLDAEVTRAEFMQAARRLEERISGAQAFEWVPEVTAAERAAVESRMQQEHPGLRFEFTELDPSGQRLRAAERPVYYPICYIQPLPGNEPALGFDLATGPTIGFLERARQTRRALVTHQVRLVQEPADQLGVIMILPVFRPGGSALPTEPAASATDDRGAFIGFLQCVFRVHDLLEHARAAEADPVLDKLFLDASETDPARRFLYYRPAADGAARLPAPTEDEFRRGLNRELPIAFGGRDWRVLYRPRDGWIESQLTATPLLRSGSLMLVAVLLAGLVHLGGRQTALVQQQVDERTAELAESRRQLATLLHALPGMAYRCRHDTELRVLFASEGVRPLTGWEPADFTSGRAHFRDLIHPEDVARVRAETRRALEERSDLEVEYRIRTRDGREKWLLSRGRGNYGPDGKLLNFEGLAIDITAQKHAENERLSLERKLLEGQKLESLGLLAGGIAHDFNNLLSTILGNASMARISLPPDTSSDAQLRAIESASLRAAELCRQMLAYAGKGRFVVEPTDVTALVEDLLPLLRISIARQASLELQLGRGLPPVMADATQLRQIVMNLVLNAADAIGERGGEITLSTGFVAVDAAGLAGCVTGADLPPGDFVFIEVRDTGCGMTSETMARIFDPFFSTKFAGRGLGLAAVLGIVRSHRGALRVASQPGHGSVFRLMLPAARGSAKVGYTAEPPAKRWSPAGHVLVIEDEEPVRVVTVELLKSFGFTARGAANGTEGIALFRENPARYALVVLDLLMPGLSGEQTLTALRGIRPDVRVLVMTGYTDDGLVERLGGAGPLAFISKPFAREAFEAKLRELLG